ncbi:hypothetical protein PQR71_18075 [Paraburkholderia fungorum]|uniref:hypothetical protein n=1 Tax=Paraburkholderia fungorum TaxID=134537 RepID=UPI0038B94727
MTTAAPQRLTLLINIEGVLHDPVAVLDLRSFEERMSELGQQLLPSTTGEMDLRATSTV